MASDGLYSVGLFRIYDRFGVGLPPGNGGFKNDHNTIETLLMRSFLGNCRQEFSKSNFCLAATDRIAVSVFLDIVCVPDLSGLVFQLDSQY